MPTPKILIVGAGPTGSVLALWLTRLEVPVRFSVPPAQTNAELDNVRCVTIIKIGSHFV